MKVSPRWDQNLCSFHLRGVVVLRADCRHGLALVGTTTAQQCQEEFFGWEGMLERQRYVGEGRSHGCHSSNTSSGLE